MIILNVTSIGLRTKFLGIWDPSFLLSFWKICQIWDIFQKRPLLATFRTKFGQIGHFSDLARSFQKIWPAVFKIGHFWPKWPKNRPPGNADWDLPLVSSPRFRASSVCFHVEEESEKRDLFIFCGQFGWKPARAVWMTNTLLLELVSTRWAS